MPIYTPTGFLDITNATLRTSNLEAENFKLNGGNIYVTTDFTTPPTLQLIAGFGNVTSNTIQFSNDTTGLVTTANVSVGKDLTVAGDINFSGTFNQNGAPFASSPWTTTGADLSYTTGNVSVGKDLTMTGTGSLIVPSGNTGQRPVNLVNGMIRYNTETGSVEAYTANSGWGAISAPPSITSVLPTSVLGANTATTTFVVTGVGITPGSTVQLEGADGTLYSVFNTTTPAAAGYQISFQMGVFGAANGYDPLQTPYKIRVANAMGIAAVGTATISLLPPTITSLSNNTLLASATGSTTITVTGTGFTSSMTGTDKVQVLGVDGTTLYPVDSVAFVDATSLTFKLSATGAVLGSPQLINRPYTVKVTGGAGLTATSTATISLLPPTITSLSNNTLLASATGSTTITVTGTGFTSSMTGTDKVQVLGVDGTTLYPVDSVAFVDATSLTFKLSATGAVLGSPQLTNRPYKVVATIGGGLTATSTATIGFSGLSWTSPAAGATLATFSTLTSANNTELAATDDVGGSGVTYSIPANNLPSPLTLNGITGAITGIIGAATAAGGVSVTFRVTDTVTGATLDRTFSIVGISPLYLFSSPFTFTNAGVTGQTGPTLSQLTTAYSPTWTDYTSNLNVTTQGIQEWTVPQTGTYEIEVYGARGRGCIGTYDTGYYGKGARMKGRFSLTKSQIVKIVVGQEGILGGSDENNYGGGGGGGSFVFTGTTPLIIAGGGGGGAIINITSPNLLSETIGIDGQITTAATLFNYDSSKSGTYGSWYVADNGANGGHWTTNSSSGYSTSTTWGARGWTDAIGGSPTFSGGIAGVGASSGGNGGFGCGGGVYNHPGGAGGGYSGGASANYAIFNVPTNHLWRTGGGGGGSYNNGSSQSNSPGVRDGHGQVIINLL